MRDCESGDLAPVTFRLFERFSKIRSSRETSVLLHERRSAGASTSREVRGPCRPSPPVSVSDDSLYPSQETCTDAAHHVGLHPNRPFF